MFKFIQLKISCPPSSQGRSDQNESDDDPNGPLVATLTLNRPRRGNAITAPMAEEILTALDQVEQNPRVRFIILTGAGKYFCTGMDMKAVSSSPPTSSSTSESEGPDDPTIIQFQTLFERIYQSPLPTLCLLNGPALGGGVGLVFCCDFRIASHPSHYLALTECKRGLIPALISIYIVPVLPPALSMEMMTLGHRVPVTVFHRLGIFNALVKDPKDPEALDSSSSLSSSSLKMKAHSAKTGVDVSQFGSVDEVLVYYTTTLLSSAPGAVRTIKQVIKRLTKNEKEREERKSYLRAVFQHMMKSEEAMYGMLCFLQKQTPNWSTLSNQQASKL